jgi:hypothetical protein
VLRQKFEWLEFQTPFIGLQMYSGRLDEHDWWYAILDTNFFTDIKQFLLAHGYVALTNDMLKAYKVAQVWIFLSGWLQGAYFLKTKSNNNNLCILRTKCSPSQTLDDDSPQCIDITPKKMMVWQKELLVLALQGMKFMHVFLYSLYRIYAVPIQDH